MLIVSVFCCVASGDTADADVVPFEIVTLLISVVISVRVAVASGDDAVVFVDADVVPVEIVTFLISITLPLSSTPSASTENTVTIIHCPNNIEIIRIIITKNRD